MSVICVLLFKIYFFLVLCFIFHAKIYIFYYTEVYSHTAHITQTNIHNLDTTIKTHI